MGLIQVRSGADHRWQWGGDEWGGEREETRGVSAGNVKYGERGERNWGAKAVTRVTTGVGV